MISTSSYKDWKTDKYKSYSISFDKGKDAGYVGNSYLDLAPKIPFFRKWRSNIGKIPDEENNRFYVNEYWNQVLKELDPEKVYNDLEYSTLLCYEDNTKFCHRHIVAAWFEILLGVTIPEVKANDYNIEEVNRPDYIKSYLEDVMRQDRNMRGFTSLRALYLFEKGDKLDAEANELEEKTGKCYDNYRQKACYFRCDADLVEYEYREKQNQKKLLKSMNK